VQIGDPNVNKESSLGKSKGKTMHKVWLWVKFLLHHQLTMADLVRSRETRDLQGRPQLRIKLQKRRGRQIFL
jgi:hypothetical protein